MGMRTEALARVTVGVLWFLVAATLVLLVWLPVGVALFAIDILWQLVTGNEGVMPMNAHGQVYSWFERNLKWTLYGEGSFDPLPYV